MGLLHLPNTFIFMDHLGVFTYCPKEPYHVFGHNLIYMIILDGYVLWYLGLTLACLIPFVSWMKYILLG